MDNGWIKLHRKLIDWEWFTEPNTLQLFLYLLLKANHEEKKWRGNVIKIGQLITSIDGISRDTKLTNKQVRGSMERLIKSGEISKKTTNKFTLITVENYINYQEKEADEGKQRANKGQTKGKQRATNKNDKNYKNDKNIIPCINTRYVALDEIATLFNDICTSYKPVKKITPGTTRHSLVQARVKEYTLEDFETVFVNAQRSDFMKGDNKRGWVATFDWIMKPSNFVKVLEGNYENKDTFHEDKQTNKFDEAYNRVMEKFNV